MSEIATKAPSRNRRLWCLAAAILFLLYFIRAKQAGIDDFIAYYNAGARAFQGISPYRLEATPYRYLPVTAFFFIPFSFFTLSVGRLVFFVVNFAAVVALYAKIRARLGDFATLLLALLFFRFHNHDFGNTQVNPILLVLFFFWWTTREKNLVFATLAFALFGSFKILPFAIGLPLLVGGRWREIQWITLWTVVLNFVPIFFYGSGPMIFQDWYEQAKLIESPAMLSNVQALQSALWWRLDGILSRSTFTYLSYGIQALLLLYAVLAAPKRNREAWMIATTVAITVIISPLAWKHNYLQFLPLAGLWFHEDPRLRERRTRILYGIAAIGLVILPWAIGRFDRVFADRLYLMPWTGLLLILLGPIFARRAESRDLA